MLELAQPVQQISGVSNVFLFPTTDDLVTYLDQFSVNCVGSRESCGRSSIVELELGKKRGYLISGPVGCQILVMKAG
jgi:hypothetical protein